MDKQQLVVLFGDSLLMDAVEATLANRDEWSLVRIRYAITDIVSKLNSLNPNLVVFDFDVIHSQFLLPLIRIKPGLSLIGLDANCNKAISLSSRQYFDLTADDLAQVIHVCA